MLYVLEEIFKSKKNENSASFNLRIQRALSWLKKAALTQEDHDLQFLSLWVSFNAIHLEESCTETDLDQCKSFIDRIYVQDQSQKMSHVVWNDISQQMQSILNSPYIFQGYWDYKNQKITQLAWKADFDRAQQGIVKALKFKDAQQIIFLLFERMLTLNNQLLAGGSGYNSSINRQLLKDSCHILLVLLPIFLELMIENAPHLDSRKPHYPIMQMS